jgi:hypothetical protein
VSFALAGLYADRVRASTLERNKFDMLKAKALAYDIDPAGDYNKPGNNPPEQAFQLLVLGFEMLLYLADNAFPSLDKRTRKKGPKWIREAALFHSEHATTALAHAMPALYAREGGQLRGDEPPELTVEHHQKLYETVRSFYPIGRGAAGAIQQWMREYETIPTGEPRKAVVEGRFPANAYSEALMRGENPRDDPELVAMQQEYARDYFIDNAIHGSITVALSPNDRSLLEKNVAHFWDLDESGSAELRQRAREAWAEGTKPYLEYALLDAR